MLIFRKTQPVDINVCFTVRARTRENPVSREQLAAVGITPESAAAALESGRVKGWVCVDGSQIVGFCSGDAVTGGGAGAGRVAGARGAGVGRRLLGELGALRYRRVWLAGVA